jgi:hypothetical protein
MREKLARLAVAQSGIPYQESVCLVKRGVVKTGIAENLKTLPGWTKKTSVRLLGLKPIGDRPETLWTRGSAATGAE